MGSLWRVACITVLMLVAAIGSLSICEEAQAGTPIMGDIVTDTTWSPLGSPYWIETHVVVRLGVELVVLAGTEIRFNGYYHLWVTGRILVEGNATDPVVFTSNRTTPAPDDWVGLVIGGEAHINFANVSYSYTGICIASSYNTVNESSFYRNDDSLVISGASQNLIRNNSFLESTNRGILMFGSSWNNLTGNNITRIWNTGIDLAGATNDTVSHNTFYRNFMNGMRVQDSHHNWISNNTILESQWNHGIDVWRSQGNLISNNILRRNNNGIHLDQSSENDISGNDISESTLYHGISLDRSDSDVMTGNHIHNVSRDGIYLESSTGNRMYENNIRDNDHGIYMYECLGSEIANNTIVENAWTGVILDASDEVSLSGNIVATHSDGGIDLFDSSNVTIWKNNLTANGLFGIRIANSTGAKIHHNNFLAHVDHALDDGGSENDWDDGYPSGGNYWDDYTGPDHFQGPNQDQPGRDGVGDDPYVIDPDSQDDYPLMYLYGALPSLGPTNVSARLSGDGFENVTLTWSLSADDGIGRNDVVKYAIHRGTTYHISAFGYSHVTNVTNGTSAYVDNFAGEGDSNDYFYAVCAINTQGIPSCGDDQAAKFTRALAQGLNLVSIPLAQVNESIGTVLQTVEYDRAWSYDSQAKDWTYYASFRAYKTNLHRMDHRMGMWIDVTETSNLTVAGTVPAQTAIHLHKGWNLVSFPSFNSSYRASDLIAETGATRVEGYDAGSPYRLRILNPVDVLQAGEAYWVRVESSVDWIVNIS